MVNYLMMFEECYIMTEYEFYITIGIILVVLFVFLVYKGLMDAVKSWIPKK